MEDKIEKVREILDKSQWQFTDARHGVIGTKYPDNRSFAKDIVRLFEPQSIEGKNKIEQVKEKLGQLDLYLTYDGHLSGMDINNILTQFNFCSQPIKITKAKFKTAYADEVDDQCSCYGLTCSCCGEEYFTEEAFPEPQLCPRCSKPIKYCDSHQPRCNARILRQEGHSLCCRYGWCEFALPSQDIDLCSQPLEGIENLREEIAELLYFDFTYYERGTLIEMAWREIPQARKDIWFNKADQILIKLTQFIEQKCQEAREEERKELGKNLFEMLLVEEGISFKAPILQYALSLKEGKKC